MSTTNDSKSARPARRTLNIVSTPDTPLDRLTSLYGDQDLAANVTSILDRYLVILHRSTPKFSDRELCVVIDALGDTWDPTPANIAQIPREVITAIITDRLDAKWNIDADKFGPRLDRTSFHERVTLAEITAAYWRLSTSDSAPQDIINQIKNLLRPPSSRTTPTSRPRRISAHLFEQATSSGTGQRPGADNTEDPDATDSDAADSTDGDTEGELSTADPDEDDNGVTGITDADDPHPGADDINEADNPTPDDSADPGTTQRNSPQDPLL